MTEPAPQYAANPVRVVVAVDASARSAAMASWVAQHVARGAELVLVHVLQAPPEPGFLAWRYPVANREQLIESARAGAYARLREMGERIATGVLWPEVRVGRPEEEIVRVAEEYDAELIVVGRRARRAGEPSRVGATARRLLRRSPVPVLLAAEMPSHAPSRVLVAVDDSDRTEPVLDWGHTLSDQFAAETTVMHVVSIPQFTGSTAAAGGLALAEDEIPWGVPKEDEPAVRRAERWLSGRLNGLKNGSTMKSAVVWGHVHPVDAILDEAARMGADLIVVGSSGSGAVPRVLFGSVAEGVLRGASCPVLVIVPPRDALPDRDAPERVDVSSGALAVA